MNGRHVISLQIRRDSVSLLWTKYFGALDFGSIQIKLKEGNGDWGERHVCGTKCLRLTSHRAMTFLCPPNRMFSIDAHTPFWYYNPWRSSYKRKGQARGENEIWNKEVSILREIRCARCVRRIRALSYLTLIDSRNRWPIEHRVIEKTFLEQSEDIRLAFLCYPASWMTFLPEV
jgi:hypothetical protein